MVSQAASGWEGKVWQPTPHSRLATGPGSSGGCWLGMKMGQNMTQTGLQSLLVLILVAVQYAGGQDLAGVLSALQGQAGEVLVKGDSVG